MLASPITTRGGQLLAGVRAAAIRRIRSASSFALAPPHFSLTYPSREHQLERMRVSQNDAAPTIAGASMGGYFHACGFFRSRDEAYRVLTPFVREGKEQGDRALHVTDPRFLADHVDRLRAARLVDGASEASEWLEVFDWNEAYFEGGRFDPDAMLDRLERTIHANRNAGYRYTRMIGDMNWALERRPGVEHLMVYEARVNVVLARHRQPGICMYDATRISGEAMLDLLRTHPLVIIGDTLTRNPFFMQPDDFLARQEAS